MATFGAKLEHLLSTRAEIISRMHHPPPAEGNDLERLLGLPPSTGPASLTPPPNVPIWSDEQSAAFCAVTPPIETFMDVPEDIRKEQFFATARRDDILVGAVSVIQDSGVVVTILAYDQGPRRDFDGLKLTGYCPLRQLPRYNIHGNVLDSFQIGDKVRAFILDVHPAGRLILSMNPKMLSRDLYGDLKLGIVTEDDLPLHYKKLQNLDGKSYEAYLESTPQFRNPDGLQVLCARMGIPRSSACSLLTCMAKIRLPKSEMACELRRTQLLNFSMKHVAQGVKYFKDGRNNEALQCYNFAIEVEPTNPDAYVARGALYASVGTYTKAVEDLEKSLELQPNHANAMNYIGQTLVAYAGEIGRKDSAKAEQLLHRALKLDPENNEAREALKELQCSMPSPNTQEAGLRSWSKTPSPTNRGRFVGAGAGGVPRDRSVALSPPRQTGGAGGGYASHMERSRAALEQLVEEDRSRRTGKDARRTSSPLQGFVSPTSGGSFYPPPAPHTSGRGLDRRRNSDYARQEMKPGSNYGMEKSNMDRGDLSKIVITRNRSGRIIRCKDDDDDDDKMGLGERGRSDGSWRRSQDDGSHRDHDPSRRGGPPDGDRDMKGNRRVFTPPRNAREGEHGSLTVYENENDLPMTSKSLQERVQARLRAIERRHHQQDESNPVNVEAVGVGGVYSSVPPPEKTNLGGPVVGGGVGAGAGAEDFGMGDSPRGGGGGGFPQGHWRGGGGGHVGFDRRISGGGGFQRPDHYGGGRGGFYPRGGARGGGPRGNMGGPRWRNGGQWDDYRGRRGNWHRYDDRRRDGPPGGGGGGGGFDRRRRRYGANTGSLDRSPRSSHSRSKSRSRSRLSRSRSRSYSGSNRSSSISPSPVRPGNRGRVISRARIKTPPLAPLTNAKRSASDENLAELDQFVAQLKAKRQMEQHFQQQHQHQYLMQDQQPGDPIYPGPQAMPPSMMAVVVAQSVANEELTESADWQSKEDERDYYQEGEEEAVGEEGEPPEPASPEVEPPATIMDDEEDGDGDGDDSAMEQRGDQMPAIAVEH